MTVRLFVATLALGLAACGASGSSGTKAPEAESQALPLSAFAFSSGWVSRAQAVPAIASRGSFCPPEMISLMLARTLSISSPARV